MGDLDLYHRTFGTLGWMDLSFFGNVAVKSLPTFPRLEEVPGQRQESQVPALLRLKRLAGSQKSPVLGCLGMLLATPFQHRTAFSGSTMDWFPKALCERS